MIFCTNISLKSLADALHHLRFLPHLGTKPLLQNDGLIFRPLLKINKMTSIKKYLCLLLLFMMIACTPSREAGDFLSAVQEKPKSVNISNSYLVNNAEGHVQGVQLFHFQKKAYYFFSGSSCDESYYAIADVEKKHILSVNTFLENPFRHAGGFQISKDLLAVGVEDNKKVDRSKVLLYQIIDPRTPELTLLKTIDRSGEAKSYTAGCVALAHQKKNLLVAVGNWDTKHIDFYTLPSNQANNPAATFKLLDRYDSQTADRSDWIEPSWSSYQSINFFKTNNRKLYLVGTALNEETAMEVVDLFEVVIPSSKGIQLKKIAHRSFPKNTTTTFKWGGGIHLDQAKGLQLFSSDLHIMDTLKMHIYSE